MSTLWAHSSNGSEMASTTRRAIRSMSSAETISGKNMVNSSPARRASSGRVPRIAVELGVDHHPQAVRDHDQQLVAAGMAEAVVDALEAIEVDEQHRRGRTFEPLAEQLVGLGSEMQPVGKRGDRIVHAERMGIVDRGAHFGEQGVDRRSQLGHRIGGRSAVRAKPGPRPRPRAAARSARASARALSLFGRSDAM